MTRPMTIAVDDDLFVLTIRLTEEYPEIPAGSVMRCVARVLRQARLAGRPARDAERGDGADLTVGPHPAFRDRRVGPAPGPRGNGPKAGDPEPPEREEGWMKAVERSVGARF
jgi:hypothetical protein